MKYRVDFVQIKDFDSLELSWKSLEDGADMTYFQTFHWYKVLAKTSQSIKNSNFEIVFAVGTRDEKTCMIAPLWIIKNTFRRFNYRGGYIFGSEYWTDYCNFIYKSFYTEMVDCIFSKIKEVYGIDTFSFPKLKESTEMYAYLNDRYEIQDACPNICVALDIPPTEEEYHKLLTKKARQNIRTAFNRLDKNRLSLVYDNNTDKSILPEFKKYRDIRVKAKNKKPLQIDINWLKNLIGERLLFSFPTYTPFEDDERSVFITSKTSDGELCAAFNVGYDVYKKELVVMAVSVNPKYNWYSPGILAMYSYILKNIGTKEIRRIDFTRGDESYKYVLGGKDHTIYSLKFHF